MNKKYILIELLPFIMFFLYLFGILDLIDMKYYKPEGYIEADANIVYVTHVGGNGLGARYKLYYTYTVDGVKYDKYDEDRTFSYGYVEGDSIVVKYNAQKPQDSYVVRIKAGTWIKDKFFYALLLVFLGFVGVVVVESKDKIIKDVRR